MCEAVGKGTCAPRPNALESLNVSFAKCHKKEYTPGRPNTLGRHACIDFGAWSRNERDRRKLALTEEVAVEYIHLKVTYSATRWVIGTLWGWEGGTQPRQNRDKNGRDRDNNETTTRQHSVIKKNYTSCDDTMAPDFLHDLP